MVIQYNQNQFQNPYSEVYKVLQDLAFLQLPKFWSIRFPDSLNNIFYMFSNSQVCSHVRASILAVPTACI